ncbi:hypothetical protein [Streptomyces sp. NPDC058268]|uniref:hypothetical protein n=1 Tax=Streptomyces sp. NPDC058268 TaxID=3346413 RepID=UPI0036E46EB5
MNAAVRRWLFLVAVLAWGGVACVNAGGEAARVDRSLLAGGWSNAGGERLRLGADGSMEWESLNSAVLGGASCPEAAAGNWKFFSPPDEVGLSVVDDAATSGDTVALNIDGAEDTCLLSGQVRRDGQGLNLCLVVDGDSDCSTEELLRRESARPTERGAK